MGPYRSPEKHGAVAGPITAYLGLAVMGPDTAPLGERHDFPWYTQGQIAATVAAFAGDWYATSSDEYFSDDVTFHIR